MESTYFDKLKVKIIMGCSCVNDYADGKDVNRNHVNYGIVTALASVIRDMGHSIDVPVWGDDGFLRIPKLEIDGQVIIEYHNGK